jgi:hypothetical protein
MSREVCQHGRLLEPPCAECRAAMTPGAFSWTEEDEARLRDALRLAHELTPLGEWATSKLSAALAELERRDGERDEMREAFVHAIRFGLEAGSKNAKMHGHRARRRAERRGDTALRDQLGELLAKYHDPRDILRGGDATPPTPAPVYTPDHLVGALHDRVHKEIGVGRPAKSARSALAPFAAMAEGIEGPDEMLVGEVSLGDCRRAAESIDTFAPAPVDRDSIDVPTRIITGTDLGEDYDGSCDGPAPARGPGKLTRDESTPELAEWWRKVGEAAAQAPVLKVATPAEGPIRLPVKADIGGTMGRSWVVYDKDDRRLTLALKMEEAQWIEAALNAAQFPVRKFSTACLGPIHSVHESCPGCACACHDAALNATRAMATDRSSLYSLMCIVYGRHDECDEEGCTCPCHDATRTRGGE